MPSYDFDFFVIGAGSGGVRAARIAAGHGARVGVAEESDLGGTCVNLGCIPKKLLSYAAHVRDEVEDAAGFGWSIPPATHDWAKLIANKNSEIQRLNGIYQRLLEGPGVEIIDGRARLLDPHTIEIGDRKVTAERILIATGGTPSYPTEPGTEEYGITSDDAFHLEEMPKRVVIAGGGYIAVEFASIFHGLGAEVVQLYRGEMFLRGFDNDIRDYLAMDFAKRGIDLRFRTIIKRLEKSHDGLIAHLTDEVAVEADCVLFAIGRKPNTQDLGLEAAGVAMDDKGAITVDADYRTSQGHIYAIGDVTNRVNLTPVATAEGHYLADKLFGPGRRKPSYEMIPTAVFSHPTIATVGITEQEARAAGKNFQVFRSSFRPLKATLSGRDERSIMKLIVDKDSEAILGCHMIGPDAPEIMQGFAVAIVAGAKKSDFDRTIGIHPTAAEEFVTMRDPVPDAEDFED